MIRWVREVVLRGRLINPFWIELAQLDTAATEAAGYDHELREPVQIDDGTQAGADARAETLLRIRVQIEPWMFNSLQKYINGGDRNARFVCIAHFADLERAGLIGADGQPLIRVNDRLAGVYEDRPGEPLVMQVASVPGLYLRETMPIGFGLGKKRNLLQLDFYSRSQGQ